MSRSAAPLSSRVVAVAIDVAVSAAVTAVVSSVVVTLSVVTDGAVPVAALAPTAALAGFAWFLVQTAMQGRSGSIGMRVTGLRLAHADDDDDLGFGRSLGRNLVWMLTGSVIVGFFSPLFDPSKWRRGWHDLAAGAVMTDAVSALPPRPLPAPVGTARSRPDGGIGDGARPATASRAESRPAVIPLSAASLPEPVAAAVATPGGAPVAVAATPAVPAATPAVPAATPAVPAAWAPAPRTAAAAARTLPVDVISTVPGVPARGGIRPGAPTVAASTLALLVWDDGTRHSVYDPTLFGRSPAAEDGLRVTPVRDETLSISKTHFEVGADAQGAWIVDRHSLNGVVIVRGGEPQRIAPGERARLWSGDVLELGDRRVTVESAR